MLLSPFAPAFWRRLDAPGHDVCRLEKLDAGWRLRGTALFLSDGEPAELAYEAECDEAWVSRRGSVRGWRGSSQLAADITRSPSGAWLVNGAPSKGVGHAQDLDFGFTPSTNFFQLRRLALAPGQADECPAAWFDLENLTLSTLVQRYTALGDGRYGYDAPRFSSSTVLIVDEDGWVREYPGLWRREPMRKRARVPRARAEKVPRSRPALHRPVIHDDVTLADAIVAVSWDLKRLGTSELGSASPTLARLAALEIIRREPGVHPSDVAEVLGTSRQAGAKMVDLLVAEGWVSRKPDPSDSRAIRLTLTAKGDRELQEAQELQVAVLRPTLDGLTADEKRTLNRLLATLRANAGR